MDNQDFVSYETAKRLKECGFDEPCNAYWYKSRINSDEMALSIINNYADHNNDDWYVPHCSAPTLWQTQKWLREEKELFIEVIPNFGLRARKTFGITGHSFSLYDSRGHLVNDERCDDYPTYEAALSAGIEAALNLLNNE